MEEKARRLSFTRKRDAPEEELSPEKQFQRKQTEKRAAEQKKASEKRAAAAKSGTAAKAGESSGGHAVRKKPAEKKRARNRIRFVTEETAVTPIRRRIAEESDDNAGLEAAS